MNSPGQRQGEVVQTEDLAQVLPARGADGPQRVTAALQLRHRHILMSIGLQELQGTLGYTPWHQTMRFSTRTAVLYLGTYRCVAVGAGEGGEVFLRQIFELILLCTHGKDGL